MNPMGRTVSKYFALGVACAVVAVLMEAFVKSLVAQAIATTEVSKYLGMKDGTFFSVFVLCCLVPLVLDLAGRQHQRWGLLLGLFAAVLASWVTEEESGYTHIHNVFVLFTGISIVLASALNGWSRYVAAAVLGPFTAYLAVARWAQQHDKDFNGMPVWVVMVGFLLVAPIIAMCMAAMNARFGSESDT